MPIFRCDEVLVAILTQVNPQQVDLAVELGGFRRVVWTDIRASIMADI